MLPFSGLSNPTWEIEQVGFCVPVSGLSPAGWTHRESPASSRSVLVGAPWFAAARSAHAGVPTVRGVITFL